MIARSAMVLVVLVAACTPEIPDGRFVCTRDEDCPPDFSCTDGLCSRGPGRDGGLVDARLDGALRDAPLPDGAVVDAPADGGAPACVTDLDCSDDVFCNGVERCDPSLSGADATGCAPPDVTAVVCLPDQTCDETGDECLSDCDTNPDADGDTHEATSCGGDDCNDADDAVFPGATEVCDAVDDDCDPTTLGGSDGDGDGELPVTCCNPGAAGATCGTDCNDASASMSSVGVEACNGLDDDCDGTIDDGVVGASYADGDMDGFGTGAVITTCPPPAGTASNDDDCDDTRATVRPTGTETCNALDDDCDGTVDDGFGCAMGSTTACTFTAGSCSTGGVATCSATCTVGACTATTAEICNRADDDCDGDVDENLLSLGTTVTLAPSSNAPRGEWSEDRGEAAIVYGVPAGPGVNEVWMRRIAATGSPLAPAVRIAANGTGWDVTFDGVHWSVIVTDGTGLALYRVEAGTDAVSRLLTVSTSNDVARIARVQTLTDVVIVQSTEPLLGRYYRYSGTTASVAPVQLGTAVTMEDYTAFSAQPPPVVSTTFAGASIYTIEFTGTYRMNHFTATPAAPFVRSGSRTSFGANCSVLAGAGAMPSTTSLNSTVLVYCNPDGLYLMGHTSGSPSGGFSVLLPAGATSGMLAYAGDTSFGLVRGGALERRRASNGALVDTGTLALSGSTQDFLGVASTETRYLGLLSTASGDAMLQVQPVVCR